MSQLWQVVFRLAGLMVVMFGIAWGLNPCITYFESTRPANNHGGSYAMAVSGEEDRQIEISSFLKKVQFGSQIIGVGALYGLIFVLSMYIWKLKDQGIEGIGLYPRDPKDPQ